MPGGLRPLRLQAAVRKLLKRARGPLAAWRPGCLEVCAGEGVEVGPALPGSHSRGHPRVCVGGALGAASTLAEVCVDGGFEVGSALPRSVSRAVPRVRVGSALGAALTLLRNGLSGIPHVRVDACPKCVPRACWGMRCVWVRGALPQVALGRNVRAAWRCPPGATWGAPQVRAARRVHKPPRRMWTSGRGNGPRFVQRIVGRTFSESLNVR